VPGGPLRENFIDTWSVTSTVVVKTTSGEEIDRIDGQSPFLIKVNDDNTIEFLNTTDRPDTRWIYQPNPQRFAIVQELASFASNSFGEYFDVISNEPDRILLRTITMLPPDGTLPERTLTKEWLLE